MKVTLRQPRLGVEYFTLTLATVYRIASRSLREPGRERMALRNIQILAEKAELPPKRHYER